MFNKGQLAGLMKQAQAMQDNLKKAQAELALIEVTGESGAGLVKVTMTCKHDVKRVTIDPSLLADDKDMLEDLVAAAFNAAVRKAEETSQEKLGKISAGMPGLPTTDPAPPASSTTANSPSAAASAPLRRHAVAASLACIALTVLVAVFPGWVISRLSAGVDGSADRSWKPAGSACQLPWA